MTQKNSNGTSDSLLADPSKLRVIVVGAGIGGLTAAVACKEKGFTVTVLEATEKFTHVSLTVFTLMLKTDAYGDSMVLSPVFLADAQY